METKMETFKTNMKNKTIDVPSKGEIVIYRAKDKEIQLRVKLEQETVWLTQKQMGDLFDKDVRTINEHIQNIFKEKELKKNSVIRNFRITAADGKSYETNFYNLDVIISVGYRIKSQNGTRFRIWATDILKRHLIDGYTLNEQRLKEQTSKLQALQRTVKLIASMKDRNFIDGNKRIAASIFLWFLEKNAILYKEDGSKRIADNALVALTLMVAESKPSERNIIVTLVVNLINKNN